MSRNIPDAVPVMPADGLGPSLLPDEEARRGVIFALWAYFLWGMAPLYFKAVADVPPTEVIAHRVLWTVLLMAGVLVWRGGFSRLAVLRTQPAQWGWLALTSLLISSNWLVFVWAVTVGRVLETSLGYYINPLMTMLLGVIFLGERLRPLQRAAIGLAAMGVVNRVWQVGELPWVSLFLAVTFALYSLLRKRVRLDASGGLFIETLLMLPLALLYLGWLAQAGDMAFAHRALGTDVLLVLAGVVTAVPLVLFAAGARRLPLTTLGFLQYLAPTLTFLLAVLVFGEPFGWGQVLTFAMIWAGLALYSLDALRIRRRAIS
jgi:chloramphenicol-sensitive protein RarD